MEEPLKVSEFRAGFLLKQTGFQSFIPEPVNRQWHLDLPETAALVAEAHQKIGELNAFSQLVPDVDFFISMHIAKEATTSSKIEGTQTVIEETFLQKEEIDPERRDDWQEVQNYIQAMNFAITKLDELPLSSRLIRKTHQILMQGVRGTHKLPGEFRKSQNWIGGASLKDARFIPPPHDQVPGLMSDLEKFLHNDTIYIPELLRIAIAHYQFETIHPFLDGNGRIGRLLITLDLVDKKLLKYPALYLSDFFERNRLLYYDNLTLVRTQHDLNQWLKFFMVGVIQTAERSIATFRNMLALKEKGESQISTLGRRFPKARIFLHYLFTKPLVDYDAIARQLGVSHVTANSLIQDFIRLGLLEETTGYQRNRIYAFRPYLNIFNQN